MLSIVIFVLIKRKNLVFKGHAPRTWLASCASFKGHGMFFNISYSMILLVEVLGMVRLILWQIKLCSNLYLADPLRWEVIPVQEFESSATPALYSCRV